MSCELMWSCLNDHDSKGAAQVTSPTSPNAPEPPPEDDSSAIAERLKWALKHCRGDEIPPMPEKPQEEAGK